MAEHVHTTPAASAMTNHVRAEPDTLDGSLTRAPGLHATPPVSAASRRGLFGAMGALLLFAAAKPDPAGAEELDGELVALCDEAVAIHAASSAASFALDASGLSTVSVERAVAWKAILAQSAKWQALVAAITALPARTPEGIRGKANVLADVVALDEPLVASLCSDLLGRIIDPGEDH